MDGRTPSPPHERWMKAALSRARRAAAAGEVPVGAVVVMAGRLVAGAGNRVERDRDPMAHAEALALRRALRRTGAKWLADATLYVTLEPCPQCAGAVVLCRVGQVVFGARDPKAGAFGSVEDFAISGRLNHVPRVVPGILAADAGSILSGFFAGLRAARKGM